MTSPDPIPSTLIPAEIVEANARIVAARDAAARPRYRVTTTGWVRHDGGDRPGVLKPDDRVDIIVRAGNATWCQDFPAAAHRWPHIGFSGDILYWRPARALSPATDGEGGE